MLNNIFRRIYIKIRYDDNGKTKGFTFFLPFSSITEPFEDFVDFMTFLSLILPSIHFNIRAQKDMTLKTATSFLTIGENLLEQVASCEPFDMVDVETNDTSVKISVR